MQSKLLSIETAVKKLEADWERYRPMIERYELAAQANTFWSKRKALKNAGGEGNRFDSNDGQSE
jgi:hypothetical protein